MRRARGCGGRFLNTKKMENNGFNPNTEGVNSGASNQTQSGSSSGSEALPSDSSGNPGSASPAAMSMQRMYEPHKYGSNHDVDQQQQQHSGFQLSAYHSNPSERMEEGDCSGQQRGSRMLVNQSQNRAVAIQ